MVVLKNYKEKGNKVEFKFQKTINDHKYNLLSFITNKNELFYKSSSNHWHNYKIGEKDILIGNLKQELNKYVPIILFYQNINEDIKKQYEKNISEMHLSKNDYAKAIINYISFKKEMEKFKTNETNEAIKKIYLISFLIIY